MFPDADIFGAATLTFPFVDVMIGILASIIQPGRTTHVAFAVSKKDRRRRVMHRLHCAFA
jgi:hypothetical protein